MKRIVEFFFGRRLRNKAGGFAWVKAGGLHSGAEAMVGAAVCTVSVTPEGMWHIEPVLAYIATAPQRFASGERVYMPGEVIRACAIHDSSLEPWKEDGVTDSEVSELFAPECASAIRSTKEAQT